MLSSQGDVDMENGGAGMLVIRMKLVTQLMTKMMMEIGGIVMMMIQMMVSMNVIKMIKMMTGGWRWEVSSEEAITVQQRTGFPPLSA